ncbi:hypothetical protein BDA99DRAFT_532812 [Phascolomyces articulosus]|uniref:Galactose oxidase n=1 Tax=Phascolomyces articulosus TaxID=60185 RepID=A0AAD5KNC7_9FUNG|nr:hypothetical protein BDA99DRAFT_532812 [Phascolomyces articulosus]
MTQLFIKKDVNNTESWRFLFLKQKHDRHVISIKPYAIQPPIIQKIFFLVVDIIIGITKINSGCAFLSAVATIYCYGGQIVNPSSSNAVTAITRDVFVTLNLSRDRDISGIQEAWERLSNTVGPNYYFVFEAIPSQERIFMEGGVGSGDGGQTLPIYNTTMFDAADSSNIWANNIPSRSGALTQSHTATLGQDGNIIYIWGGFRGTATGLSTGTEYPLEMFMFDVANSRWSTGASVQSLQEQRYYHSAVRVESSIYYIGGLRRTVGTNGTTDREGAPMDSIPIFDTSSGQWRYQSATGQIPSTRLRHTSTLILTRKSFFNNNVIVPSTGQIVLFGGQVPVSGNDDLQPDYFYLLDTNQMSWSNRTIGEESGASFVTGGLRGHSAILIGDNLFIMFGRTTAGLSNRIWVLDVNRWAWISSITAVMPDSTSTTSGVSNKSMSPGAIAGAVIGAVGGVAIAGAIVFFFLRRKRNQKSNNKRKFNSNNFGNDDDHEILSKIDSPPMYNDEQLNAGQKPTAPADASHYSAPNPSNHPDYHYVAMQSSQLPHSQPTFYSSESPPYAPVSENRGAGSNDTDMPNRQIQHFVLAPVKPDGAGSST